jgi:NAD(P)-dependent dehydrogenase (short-subunit alcohol dehydrogenase family)
MAGRVYVITGAFGVLGSAVAAAAAGQGVRLALIDYGKTPPGNLVQAVGPDALILGGVDLTDEAAATAAIEAVVSRFGCLDVLVNVAGGFRWQTLEGSSANSWHALFKINVLTATNTSRAAIPHLKASSSGRIVNVGANGALKASLGMGAYAASKAGVHALTQSLAEELKDHGATVNAVLPSIIDTPANRADMPKADPATWVAPADLAAVILFLASEEARAVTGALLPVTGRV